VRTIPAAASVLEVVLQTVLSFSAILVYTRILGKQQIGQLTSFEYITGITFGSIAAALATDIEPDKTLEHFVGLTVFAALAFLLGHISMINRPARKVIGGEPTVVVQNGQILDQNMKKMRYNLDELLMQLREKDIFRVDDVEFALLEPNGNLSVLPKSQRRPVTPNDLGIPTEYEGLNIELVMDGEIIRQNLRQLRLTEEWLRQELQKRGVTDMNQVVYAAIASNGKLYTDLKKDSLVMPIDISDWPKP
jgi:uncharacterized membrane protein YcaP (DUF421 family)